MLERILDITIWVVKAFACLLIPLYAFLLLFYLASFCWYLWFRYRYGMKMQPSGARKVKRFGLLRQLFIEVPRRYTLDLLEREPDTFTHRGIHVFCGEQGCGKTISAVEMIMKMQKEFPRCKTITNFALETEDDELDEWQQLLTYNNGKQGVIVGIDEIQNWFMSGRNQLPNEMLEVATQNRKNHRIIVATAQVFTRVNKGLREQFSYIYFPHTFFNCWTVVIKRKPVFDSEGNVLDLKIKGMYCFTHTDELRNAYDTYKVIHTLAKEGFKDQPVQNITNVYVADGKKK